MLNIYAVQDNVGRWHANASDVIFLKNFAEKNKQYGKIRINIYCIDYLSPEGEKQTFWKSVLNKNTSEIQENSDFRPK